MNCSCSSGPCQVLIADDDPISRRKLTLLCEQWGYGIVVVNDGDAAWKELCSNDSPAIALMDWQMPGKTGDEICRLARRQLPTKPLHIILVSATQVGLESMVAALDSGADDFLTKDYNPSELHARLQVGARLIGLQRELRQRVRELENALAQVHQLQGLLPICMDCKKIRDDGNYWHQVEKYIAARADVSFTHSLCPACFDKRRRELGLPV